MKKSNNNYNSTKPYLLLFCLLLFFFNLQAQKITITFDTLLPNANISIQKSILKYNKDFAYSFTLDDGYLDAYTAALPLLKGGLASDGKTYKGFFYTDGCGNSIPFRSGIAWNSVNALGNDTHNGDNTIYMTWKHLDELYDNGWDVFNHSFSHKAGTKDVPLTPSSVYDDEVAKNADYVKKITNNKILMTHFVVPTGDTNYYAPAKRYGARAIYDQYYLLPGFNGYQVDERMSNNFKMFRYHLDNLNYSLSTIDDNLKLIATKSDSSKHFWLSEFTHAFLDLPDAQSYGTLSFDYFAKHLEYLANTYGAGGSDRVWMAPLQEVQEYIALRDNITYTTTRKGNQLEINFDMTNVPKDLRHTALSFSIKGANFNKIERCGNISNVSFNGTGNKKLINIDFGLNPSPTNCSVLKYPDLQLSLSSPNKSYKLMKNVMYKLTLSNKSSSKSSLSNAKDIIVKLDIPKNLGISYSSYSAGSSFDERTGKWTIPSLAAGASVTLELTTIPTSTQGTITLHAQVVNDKTIGENVIPSNGIWGQPLSNDEAVLSLVSDNSLLLNVNDVPFKILSFYPNPVENRSIVELESDIETENTIEIYNFNSILIKKLTFALPIGTTKQEVDTSELPVGVYYMLISNKEGVKTQPILFSKL